MSKPLSNSFNLEAGKIVANKEWRQKTKVLYRAELSATEKAHLYLVDRPLSAVAGVAMGVRDIFNKKGSKGAYLNTEPFGLYVSGAFLNDLMSDSWLQPLMLDKKFQAKINALAAKAFEQCEDVSQKPIMKSLKPL